MSVKEKDKDKITQMLNDGKCDINALDFDDKSALNYAADDLSMIKFLIQEGANFHNLPKPMLCEALKNKNSEVRDFFLEKDVDVNELCDKEYGYSPLYQAITEQDLESVKILIAKGANAGYVTVN